ncbi:hypothetical protein CDEF62S_02567 [Castellaniella defragrans]
MRWNAKPSRAWSSRAPLWKRANAWASCPAISCRRWTLTCGLYDALYDLFGFERTQRLFEKQTIEIAPLAYMRGRTLNHAFIILDEAQNTTPEQMKMFLTRIGFGSKAVINGDPSQVDLPKGHQSGLLHALDVLDGVPGIAQTRFTSRDVVRHPLVARIVDAYEQAGDHVS